MNLWWVSSLTESTCFIQLLVYYGYINIIELRIWLVSPIKMFGRRFSRFRWSEAMLLNMGQSEMRIVAQNLILVLGRQIMFVLPNKPVFTSLYWVTEWNCSIWNCLSTTRECTLPLRSKIRFFVLAMNPCCLRLFCGRQYYLFISFFLWDSV